jgi:hypothetical protein
MAGKMMIHCVLCVAMSLAAAQTGPDEAVARGRASLDRSWGGYPWYDADRDNVRTVEIPKIEPVEESPRPEVAGAGSGGIMMWAVWLGVAAVLLAVALVLVRTYLLDGGPHRGERRARMTSKTDEDRRFEALPFPVKAARFDLLAEARRHYAEGRYGEAIKYLFSHELIELDKHRVVRLTRGKTNRQYLRELGGPRGPLGAIFEATMLVFEDSFFGNHPIEQARFESCWTRLGDFDSRLKGATP